MIYFFLSCIVAVSFIGIECYDKEQSLKTEMKDNYIALWVGALLPFVGMILYSVYLYTERGKYNRKRFPSLNSLDNLDPVTFHVNRDPRVNFHR